MFRTQHFEVRYRCKLKMISFILVPKFTSQVHNIQIHHI
ncbi:unnamed protein product [Linum tenue]|uniref:Uncharacterized protein n=1 Tax=Linum tenue TaxID=586396 RepID=A0AAV0LJN1_9ROSI|nr:unnamed protein product [Linum tenue]